MVGWLASDAGPGGSSGTGSTSSQTAIYAYLDRLPGPTLARLYASPSSALSITRLLPLSARHLVINLLWLPGAIPLADIQLWFTRRSDGKKQLQIALDALNRLHIVEYDRDGTSLGLNENFQKAFKRALTGGGSHNSFGVPIHPSALNDTIDLPFLDNFANTSWETILHFLVGSSIPSVPSPKVLETLKSTGLMSGQIQGRHGLKITSTGFQFLLKDTNSQIWDILFDYLKSVDEEGGAAGAGGKDVVEVLGALFMLGSLELGKAYEKKNLSASQRDMLKDFSDFGMVYLTDDSSLFYPTRLATTLTSQLPPLVAPDAGLSTSPSVLSSTGTVEQGYIIVETNYKVYAYTSNPLQIAVLNLFVTFKSRFPNFVIGNVTRESIKKALSNGISSAQIIDYLHKHAHPELKKQSPILPPTVIDQIKLWELEKNRMVLNEGYLYEDFKTKSDFDLVKNYASQLELIKWMSEEEKKFFVDLEGHQVLREFIKRRMAMAQQQQQQAGAGTPGPS